jgi:hypothetical protein
MDLAEDVPTTSLLSGSGAGLTTREIQAKRKEFQYLVPQLTGRLDLRLRSLFHRVEVLTGFIRALFEGPREIFGDNLLSNVNLGIS